MLKFETLTHPEYFEGQKTDDVANTSLLWSTVGPILGDRLNEEGKRLVLSDESLSQVPITVAIRTLNEAGPLGVLLDSIKSQRSATETQVVVVDNESTDDTVKVAKRFGAEVITISREAFSYPKSMNACMEAADNELVFMTVGHAVLASTLALESAKRDFVRNQSLGGAFVPPLPSAKASKTELFLASFGNPIVLSRKSIKKATLGVMGSTNAVFHKDIWSDMGKFNEDLGNGGEDTQFAAKMLEAGFTIQRDPLLAVHHSHGLGPANYLKQFRAWMQMAAGKSGEFDRDSISARRPDLDFS